MKGGKYQTILQGEDLDLEKNLLAVEAKIELMLLAETEVQAALVQLEEAQQLSPLINTEALRGTVISFLVQLMDGWKDVDRLVMLMEKSEQTHVDQSQQLIEQLQPQFHQLLTQYNHLVAPFTGSGNFV